MPIGNVPPTGPVQHFRSDDFPPDVKDAVLDIDKELAQLAIDLKNHDVSAANIDLAQIQKDLGTVDEAKSQFPPAVQKQLAAFEAQIQGAQGKADQLTAGKLLEWDLQFKPIYDAVFPHSSHR